MNKKILKILFVFMMVFLFANKVYAGSTATYSNSELDISFTIDKSKFTVNEFDVVSQYLGETEVNAFNTGGGASSGQAVSLYFYTSTGDLAYNKKDIWWENVYYCVAIDYGFGFIGADISAGVFTDSMSSFITGSSGAGFKVFGESENCKTFNVKGVAKEKTVSYCKNYSEMAAEITDITKKYAQNKNLSYKTAYNEKLDYLKSSCKTALESASYNDACIKRCTFLSEDIAIWDKTMNPNKTNGTCGFSQRLLVWIKNVLKWIKYIIPIAVIIFSMIDFIKTIGSDKNDEMKKAQGKFIRRLIAAALVFIIPLIIEFILDKMGFIYEDCGLF